MDYLAKAMSLFENGVPTHQEYADAILKPRRGLPVVESRVNSSAIDAIGYYISAYEGLQNGEINRAYKLLVVDQCFAEDLPSPLTTNTLKRIRDERIEKAVSEDVIAGEFKHAKQVITDLVSRLEKKNLALSFDDDYGQIYIGIEHKETGRMLNSPLEGF